MGSRAGRRGLSRSSAHREVIEVRGGAPVVEEVIVTARGPILTPMLDGFGMALSLRATWLQPAPVRGLLDVVARDRLRDVPRAVRAPGRVPRSTSSTPIATARSAGS